MSLPLVAGGHRSHSQLNDYLHCSWAFRLKRLYGVPESPSVWLPGGKAFHSATEEFDIDAWREGLDDAVEASDYYQQVFILNFEAQIEELTQTHPDTDQWRTAGRKTTEKPNGEDLAWWYIAGQQMVAAYVGWRAEHAAQWEIAAIAGEAAVEVKVNTRFGGVEVVGYVDRLFRSKTDGRLVLVDMKTGTRIPPPVQLAQYSVQLEGAAGEPILWGAYYDARKATLTDLVDLSPWTSGKFAVIYSNLDRAAREGIFLPNITPMCRSCGVRDACVFQGGVDPQADHADQGGTDPAETTEGAAA